MISLFQWLLFTETGRQHSTMSINFNNFYLSLWKINDFQTGILLSEVIPARSVRARENNSRKATSRGKERVHERPNSFFVGRFAGKGKNWRPSQGDQGRYQARLSPLSTRACCLPANNCAFRGGFWLQCRSVFRLLFGHSRVIFSTL